MNDLLPILSGLIVISALAVVSSNDKKENKEVRERKEYKPREKNDDDLKKIFGYFKKNLSAKRKPKRYHKVYSKGRTKRDRQGDTIYKFKEASKL